MTLVQALLITSDSTNHTLEQYKKEIALWGFQIELQTHLNPVRDYGSSVMHLLTKSIDKSDVIVFDFSTETVNHGLILQVALAVGTGKNIYILGNPPSEINDPYLLSAYGKVTRFGDIQALLKEIAIDGALTELNNKIDIEVIRDVTVRGKSFVSAVYVYAVGRGALKITGRGVDGLQLDWENLYYDEIPF